MEADDSSSRVLLALMLSLAAGASTGIGALVPFFISRFKTLPLVISLGVAAGVMIYASFVEVFAETQEIFMNAGFLPAEAYGLTTGSFFAGAVFAMVLDALIHLFVPFPDYRDLPKEMTAVSSIIQGGSDHPNVTGSSTSSSSGILGSTSQHSIEQHRIVLTSAAAAATGGNGAVALTNLASANKHHSSPAQDSRRGNVRSAPGRDSSLHSRFGGGASNEGRSNSEDSDVPHPQAEVQSQSTPPVPGGAKAINPSSVSHHSRDVIKVGLSTGLALALHNFPEGMATFFSTISDPSFGISIAVAVAVHNIPEGIAVSVPIYYATGSKWKAFLYSLLTGMAEPVGGLVAYLFLVSFDMNKTVFGVILGMVAGIMVLVATHSILPLAFRSEVKTYVVSLSVFLGMVIMSISLVVLKATGKQPPG